jgi:hypothetical protein
MNLLPIEPALMSFSSIAQEVCQDLQKLLHQKPKEHYYFAMVAFCATAKLRSLASGYVILTAAKENEAAAVLLRPMLETSVSCAYICSLAGKERERVALRFLELPVVKGRLDYLSTVAAMEKEEKGQTPPWLLSVKEYYGRCQEKLKKEPGGLDRWHGLGSFDDLCAKVGLIKLAAKTCDLLHADMHGPVLSQYLAPSGSPGDKFLINGRGSLLAFATPMFLAPWCPAMMKAEDLLPLDLRARIGSVAAEITVVAQTNNEIWQREYDAAVSGSLSPDQKGAAVEDSGKVSPGE